MRLTAFLGKARIWFQVDFGFGGRVDPESEDCAYPVLLEGLPAPRIRAYRREVSVAEKFEAMVVLGRRNSRMKDFHDVWALSSSFDFEGRALLEAIAIALHAVELSGLRSSPMPSEIRSTPTLV